MWILMKMARSKYPSKLSQVFWYIYRTNLSEIKCWLRGKSLKNSKLIPLMTLKTTKWKFLQMMMIWNRDQQKTAIIITKRNTMTGKTKLSNKPFCRICSCLKTVLTLKNSKINRMKRNLQSSVSKDNSHLQSKARLLNLTKYWHFLQEI